MAFQSGLQGKIKSKKETKVQVKKVGKEKKRKLDPEESWGPRH